MNEKSNGAMYAIAKFIVHKRTLFFLLFAVATAFCVCAMGWTQVENDLTAYLDDTTATRVGLDLMDEEFVTFGSAQVMLGNIDFTSAQVVADQIATISGVDSVTFEADDVDSYQNGSALISVSFDGAEDDPLVVSAMAEIRAITAPYDVAYNTSVGASTADSLAAEMRVILIVAVIIIVIVLLFTSKSYAEIPIFLLTFGVAALLNMGTNFIFGEISFVSNSIAVVLQLALAIDYAIILIHRYAEEREQIADPKEACTVALSKAIVEISSSSLTTISGLLAMSFMNFNLGGDMSKVLIKAILLSLLSVFTLMPGLLVLFTKVIDKTTHKTLVPSIAPLGRISIKTRYVVVPIFLAIAIGAAIFSTKTNYLFDADSIRGEKLSESDIQKDRIAAQFGKTNVIAIIVPSGDYDSEAALLAELEAFPEVDMTLGLANTEAMDDYMLTESLNARQFSELMELDYEEATMIYAAYAVDNEDYGKIVNDLDNYALPLIDTVLFVCDLLDDGYLTLDADDEADLREQAQDIRDGQLQLESEDYTRILLSLDLPIEGAETFAFLDTLYDVCGTYYDEVHLVGAPTSSADLSATFDTDNLIISVLSALFVMAVLLLTFRSVAVPILLIVVIQSAIFINFAFPYVQGTSLFFIGYLVVSAIQMGANVDYAIVITNRYMDLRKSLPDRGAIVRALDESFPTIFTSGTILAASGFVIQNLTTNGTIATLGQCIGRGTLISMVLVLLVLPQLLYFSTKFIDKTSFSRNGQTPQEDAQ